MNLEQMMKSIKGRVPDPETMKSIQDLADRDRKALERLEQLPSENFVIPRKELETIRAIREILLGYMSYIEEQRLSYENNPMLFPQVLRGGEQEQEVLRNMMNFLDKYDDIWLCKFSTESQGDGKNLSETPNDSIYYMTNSGASIRFKMANLKEGIECVVQPFADFIYFESPEEGASEIPKLGYFTQEYFTQEFTDLIKGDEKPEEDYHSSIRKYYNNGKLEDVPKTSKIKFQHNGSPVNRIFFENNK